jgi:hypothetical protein
MLHKLKKKNSPFEGGILRRKPNPNPLQREILKNFDK